MIFLDTSYLGALLIRNDAWHESAKKWTKCIRGSLLTSDYILLEFADGFARPHWRERAIRAIDGLRKNPSVKIVPQSNALFERGWELYQSRNDKAWSLTDCLSFIVMSDAGCVAALTADEHFAQAGFRTLLRDEPPG